jgi:hypothetical protein
MSCVIPVLSTARRTQRQFAASIQPIRIVDAEAHLAMGAGMSVDPLIQ